MTKKPPIKSALQLIKPSAVKAPAKEKSASPPQPSGEEIIQTVSFFLEIVDNADKHCPCWAYVADPRHSDYGAKLTVCLNIAYWPAAAAIERKDWRAIRWLTSVALLERV